ncbi:Ribonucleotide reductase of class Ia (aerobic), beta subunit, partial [hydrothermal vent metagenome]
MLNWDDPTATFSNTLAADNNKIPGNVEQTEPTLNVEKQLKETQAPQIILDAKKPVRADDKRVINGKTDINQLAPFKYPWAWEFWLNANRNHWTPLDINMSKDVHDYQHRLTLEEKHVYENVLSYLTTSDIM